MKNCFLCILSALLLILSFPNFNLGVLAWVGFVPLFFALRNKTKIEAFFLAYLTGVIFWAGIIYWLAHVTLPGTILLILYLALYFGAFGLCVSYTYPAPARRGWVFLPACWVILEYLRSHFLTGFPWALLGYSQYLNLPVIQMADITGAWGVSFLVMLVNTAIYSVIGYRLSALGYRLSVIAKKQQYLVLIGCILVTLIYGYYRLYRAPSTEHRAPIKVSVIQANIPQELKWEAGAKAAILKQYIGLTEEAARYKADLIVWPEAASPGLLGEDGLVFRAIYDLAGRVKIPLLIGAVVRDGEKYFNSALLIGKTGGIAERYDKLHLVPFGEYIPLKRILPFLETVVPIGDMAAGKDYTVFSMADKAEARFKFSALICFEDLFPELSRQFVKRGAGFLLNITNDAWYKETSAPYQHLQASVFRAVENRVFLVRAANTGVSGFIAPEGRIISLVEDRGKEIFISGYKTEEIMPLEGGISFYSRYGDVFVGICVLFLLYGIIATFKKRK